MFLNIIRKTHKIDFILYYNSDLYPNFNQTE